MQTHLTRTRASLDANATFSVWKRVTLGVHKHIAAYRKALKDKNINISMWADDVIRKIDIAPIELEFALVRISATQLGFTKAARRDAIYDRASSIGLKRCVAEIGPCLREEYLDQPIGEWLIIGMAPILVPNSYPEFFVLQRNDDGSLWLNSFWAISGHVWSPGSQWVFML